MRLNPDCIRDILLSAEDNTGFYEYLDYPNELDKCPLLKKYNDEEIKYHVRQCKKSYLIEVDFDLTGNFSISDLTPSGHEFLGSIRSDNIWSKTKSVAEKIGSHSLDTLTKISVGVLTEIIKSQLGISPQP